MPEEIDINKPEQKVEERPTKDEWVEQRDVEVDMAVATEKAIDFLRKYVGNLSSKDFRLENISENGSNTRYNVICSIIPDVAQKREYYIIKVDVKTGKVIPPLKKGKLNQDGKIISEDLDINPADLE